MVERAAVGPTCSKSCLVKLSSILYCVARIKQQHEAPQFVFCLSHCGRKSADPSSCNNRIVGYNYPKQHTILLRSSLYSASYCNVVEYM